VHEMETGPSTPLAVAVGLAGTVGLAGLAVLTGLAGLVTNDGGVGDGAVATLEPEQAASSAKNGIQTTSRSHLTNMRTGLAGLSYKPRDLSPAELGRS
jgi:hypothetical protein